MTVVGDNPIREPSEDRLGRAPLAASLADQILHADASERLVVGVLGPWGSGKTSFVNLVRHNLTAERVSVLNFNPWLFSGSEHLVQTFFSELTAHVRIKLGLDRIGEMLDDYGDHLSAVPLVGPWPARAKLLLRLTGFWQKPKKSQIETTRDRIGEALKRQERPIIVVLDDLDRLTTGEIRDIFRLVRLTANFPNIVYVLAFDRHHVEEALSQDGMAGREYLEKIVQVVHDLPEISPEVLLDELTAAIDGSLSDIDGIEPFDEHMTGVWASVLIHVIMPLMRNLRDVRRYCASTRGTVMDLAGEICLPDLLALEAVRLFLPDVFTQLRSAVDTVTSPLQARIADPMAAEAVAPQVNEIVDAGGSQRGVVEALLEYVFPEGGRHIQGKAIFGGVAREWYQQRRVANTEIFRLYLERSEGQTLGWQRSGDKALSVMSDAEGFRSHLQSLEPESLRHVITSLETHEGHFRPEQVIPGVTVLLNIRRTMPEHRGGFFDLDNRFVVSRVVLRLLEAWVPREEVILAVDAILPHLETLSAQLELITIVGHRESAGHQLVEIQDAKRIERLFRDSVRDATVDALVREPDLLTVIYTAQRDASSSEPEVVVAADPRVTRSMLRASMHVVRSTSSSGLVRHSTRLHWKTLIEVYGDETVLSERIAGLRAHHPEGLTDLLELADEYLRGRRPPEWPDDE